MINAGISFGRGDVASGILRASAALPGAGQAITLGKLGKTAAEVTGRKDVKTVPQIYIKGEYIGGYDEFMTHINKGHEENDECRACEG